MGKTKRAPRRTVRRKPPTKRWTPLLRESARHNILFTGVRPQRIARVIPKLTLRSFDPGEIIFTEFSHGKELYLILEGVVRIKKCTRFGVESLLAVLHEGDFFGELSVIDGMLRSARTEASRKCTIAIFKADDFRALMKHEDAFTFNLLQNLARRLRTMDQTFILELERSTIESQRKMEQLHLLIEASKVVNSSIDLDHLLELILNAAAQSIDADRGTLYCLDEATNELWSKVAQGKNVIEIRLPVGKGLAGYVASIGETVNIADAYKDPRFNPEIDKRSGYKTRNVLCMPMRNKDGKIVGVFQFLNKKRGAFTEEDESFIDAFSVHASIALENARLARQMVQSESLSAVGKMAGTIIHDIKNPMNTLRMYAQVIKTKTADPESGRMADEIIRQVDRFVTMTRDILDFARGVSEMNTSEVSLAEVMNDVLNFIQLDLSRKKVTLQRELNYVGLITMDVEKMVRVFYNLASNATDAMPDGGTLTVRSGIENGTILIEFADTGSGIPEEIRSRIMEPFFTHGKKHGTGLGLSIVRKIVEDHRGKIQIESEQGRGTTMRLLLPA